MIKFIEAKEPVKPKEPTFKDVKVDQFFINIDHCLVQKVDVGLGHTIARADGTLFADRFSCDPDERIIKVLDKIAKIEFQ